VNRLTGDTQNRHFVMAITGESATCSDARSARRRPKGLRHRFAVPHAWIVARRCGPWVVLALRR